SSIALQLYYDRTELDLPTAAQVINGLPLAAAGMFKDHLETVEADFQHSFALGTRNRVVWGLMYRDTHDSVQNSPGLAFLPAHLDQKIYSVFLQDEVALVPE